MKEIFVLQFDVWIMISHSMFYVMCFLDDDDSLPPTPQHFPHGRGLTERDAIAMEVATRAMEEATRKMEAASRTTPIEEGPPRKRMLSEEERILAHAGMPSAHLKITSRSKLSYFLRRCPDINYCWRCIVL